MNRHDFDLLLQKYLSGECSDEEAKMVEVWSEHMITQSRIHLGLVEKKRIQNRVWKRLKVNSLEKNLFWNNFIRFGARIAAVVSLLILAVVWLVGEVGQKSLSRKVESDGAKENLTSMAQEGVITFQSEGKPKTIELEDGSRVILGKRSSIRYPVKFDSNLRTLHLEGEAFFQIVRDTKKPFLIYCGDLVTKVLGTSFSIRSYAATGKVEVEVVSGSVSVYEYAASKSNQTEELILTPNQKVVFEKSSSKKLVSDLVDDPEILISADTPDEFIFKEKPLPKVLSVLSRIFKVEIKIDSPALQSCVFTGDLNGLPLHIQLDLICRSVNGTYKQNMNSYTIKGEGCNENYINK